jgi:hypothetical protein
MDDSPKIPIATHLIRFLMDRDPDADIRFRLTLWYIGSAPQSSLLCMYITYERYIWILYHEDVRLVEIG